MRAISYTLLFCMVASSADARLFDRLRARRGGGGGDGNVVDDAPVAPPGVGDNYGMPSVNAQPGMSCGPDGCVQYPGQQLQYPSGPGGHPIIQQRTAQAIPMAPMPARVVTEPNVDVVPRVVRRNLVDSDRVSVPALDVDAGLRAEARVNRIMDVLEERLGIKAVGTSGVEGNPTAVFEGLPVIEVVRKNQKGEVEDKAVLDTKSWVREQLTQ